MKRQVPREDDRKSIEDWITHWGKLIADVDFRGVRETFAEDAIAFGSKVEMVTSREMLEQQQWRAIWPTIEDYRYDISTLHLLISQDRLMAVAAVILLSTGLHKDGSRFDRPGRVTVVLTRAAIGSPWFATHTHVSLTPGTPAPSYGSRPEKI